MIFKFFCAESKQLENVKYCYGDYWNDYSSTFLCYYAGGSYSNLLTDKKFSPTYYWG